MEPFSFSFLCRHAVNYLKRDSYLEQFYMEIDIVWKLSKERVPVAIVQQRGGSFSPFQTSRRGVNRVEDIYIPGYLRLLESGELFTACSGFGSNARELYCLSA